MAAFLRKCIVLIEEGSHFRTTAATKCCGATASHFPPTPVCVWHSCVWGERIDRKYNVCLYWPGVEALPSWGSSSFQQSWDQVESSAWALEPPNCPAQSSSGKRKHAIKTPGYMERVCLKNQICMMLHSPQELEIKCCNNEILIFKVEKYNLRTQYITLQFSHQQ